MKNEEICYSVYSPIGDPLGKSEWYWQLRAQRAKQRRAARNERSELQERLRDLVDEIEDADDPAAMVKPLLRLSDEAFSQYRWAAKKSGSKLGRKAA